MIILGIDPGLLRTGWGVLEASGVDARHLASGVIETSPRDGIAERVVVIYEGLKGLIEEFAPEVMVIEKLYSHYKHPTTSILMGHARGVVCLVAGLCGVELVNYPSTRVKKCITGSGHAGKVQVQRMVSALLGLEGTPETHDVSDALAVALAYVQIERR